VASDLLGGEGFSDIQYVQVAASPDGYKALAAGEVHMGQLFAGGLITRIDAGDPLVLIAGIHVAASSCSGRSACAACVTSRARPWPCLRWEAATTSLWRAWRHTWAWIRGRIFTGPFTVGQTPCSGSRRARLTGSSGFHPMEEVQLNS
jgi:hypothetical protein